jgi:putative hydrolase of the HAD superfamily
MKAVLFDAVATLIRPWPSVGSVYARAGSPHGLHCPARSLDAAFGPAYRELYPLRFFGRSGLQTSEPRERRWWARVVALTFERAGCAAPPPAAVTAGLEAFARGDAWRPCAGALETLAALKAHGLKTAIVSNYDSRLHRVVEELGLGPFLDAVVVSSEAGWAKPSPRIYHAALAELGLAPGEALMVGDRPVEDVAGAAAAGLQALLYDPRGLAPGPGSIRDLRQVPGRIATGRCGGNRTGNPADPPPRLAAATVPAGARPSDGRGSGGLRRPSAPPRRSR